MAKDDQEILAELKKPIDNLIEDYHPEKSLPQKVRLRQLAWQAIDVLAKTNDFTNLRNQKDIRRLTRDVRQVGGSEDFIKRSLFLATSIYKKLQIEHPGLLKRYQGRL